jgi:predicted transcriptional regulator
MRYLSEHQSFQSVSALNEALYRHTCANYFEMNETDRCILKLLGRYAVKFIGVAHLKAATIADTISKSEKTVRRSLSKLQELGVITKVKTLRKISGGYGANIYVIQPPIDVDVQSQTTNRQNEDKPVTTTSELAKNGTESFSSPSEKELPNSNTYSDEDVSVNPYSRFKQLIADKKLRNKIYGIWLAHTSYLKGAFDKDILLNVGITAAMTAFKASNVHNVAGYYNGVLDRMLDRLYLAEVHGV